MFGHSVNRIMLDHAGKKDVDRNVSSNKIKYKDPSSNDKKTKYQTIHRRVGIRKADDGIKHIKERGQGALSVKKN